MASPHLIALVSPRPFSLAWLLTASPLAALGGHILLHTAANLCGTELPYASGVAPMVPSVTRGQ
jgi:hypothetical protein